MTVCIGYGVVCFIFLEIGTKSLNGRLSAKQLWYTTPCCSIDSGCSVCDNIFVSSCIIIMTRTCFGTFNKKPQLYSASFPGHAYQNQPRSQDTHTGFSASTVNFNFSMH